MMQPETVKRLHDALGAAEELRDIAATNPTDDDRVTQLAIERLLITVGEALHHAIQANPAIEAALPDARPIIGLRNRIVHGYDSIRPEIIWDIARNHADDLIDRLKILLVDAPAPDL